MSYVPAVLGDPKLETKRNAAGKPTDYVYTFSGQPGVRTAVRTADSTEAPRDVDAFKAWAGQRRLDITLDAGGDDSNIPGCKPGDSERTVSARGNGMIYTLFTRTCGAFPSIYYEMPLALEMKWVDPLSGYEQTYTPVAGFASFPPNSEPQRMH